MSVTPVPYSEMERDLGESPAAHRPGGPAYYVYSVKKRPCLKVEGETNFHCSPPASIMCFLVSVSTHHGSGLTPGTMDKKSHFISSCSLSKERPGFDFVVVSFSYKWLSWPQTFCVYSEDDIELVILLSPPLPSARIGGQHQYSFNVFLYTLGKSCTRQATFPTLSPPPPPVPHPPVPPISAWGSGTGFKGPEGKGSSWVSFFQCLFYS